jgi:hypothetical protein
MTIGHIRSSQSVRVFTSRCLIADFNGRLSPSSGFSNCPRPQLPASHSNSSERLNPSGYLTDWLNATKSKSKSILLHDWRFTAHQLVLAPSPLRLTTRDIFFNWTLVVTVLMSHPLWWEDGFVSYENAWPFAKCTYRTYWHSRLLKFHRFAL